jgi:Fe-S-cluster containining protein
LNLPPPRSSRYGELIARLDAFDARVQAAQGLYLRCAAGCDACCRLRRTAFPVEVAAIRAHVDDLPPEERAVLRARRDAPDVRAGERCVFLGLDGRCAVYAVRPVVCRTHGPAIRTDDGLSYCALNFTALAPEAVETALPADAILNLELVNRMLVLIDAAYRSEAGLPATVPIRLDLSEALSP